jgi:hypothetical protein
MRKRDERHIIATPKMPCTFCAVQNIFSAKHWNEKAMQQTAALWAFPQAKAC